MKMILNKKIFRDLFVFKWQSLSIILVVACGVAVFVGIDMAFKSIKFTRDKFYKDLNFADLELLFIPTDIDTIPDFSDIKGISKVEKRLLFPGTIQLKDRKKLSGIFTLLESTEPKVNSLQVIDGKCMNEDDLYSVVIERSLAKHHGFKPGDPIQIKVGEKVFKNKIQGIVITPEFMTGTANPDFFAPGKGTLGVIYGNLKRNKRSLGFTLVNNLLFKFSEGVNPGELKKLILKRAKNLYLEKIIQKEDQFSYKYIEYDLNGFKAYIPAIILIMGALSFTTTFVIYNRFITNQQKEIGTLFCLGYKKRNILKSFLIGATVLGSAGTILGLFISFIVRNIFAYVQYAALDLPVLYTRVYTTSLIKGVLFGTIIPMIPPFLLLSRLFKFSPHEIIREPVKQNIIEKSFLAAITRKLPFLSLEWRYTLLNLIRQKWLTVSTICCIGLCLGVAISYITSVTSINNTVKDRFNYEYWDICADFFYPVYIEDLVVVEKMTTVNRYEPFIRKTVEVGSNNTYKDSSLLGINPKSTMKRTKLIDGFWLSGKSKEEIILNHDISEKIGVSVGDFIDLKTNHKQLKFKVVGISSEFSVGQSVVPFSVAQEIFEIPDEATGMFINAKDQSHLEEIKNNLYQLKYVGKVTEKRTLLIELLNQISEFMGIVHISTFFSIIVAIVFIFTNTNLVVFERKNEFSLLKTLGYKERSIKKIIFSNIFINGILGGLLSIPIAIAVAVFLNQRYSKGWFQVYNYFVISDFIWIILIAILLMPLMALPSIKYLKTMEISEIMHKKSIE